MRVLYFFTFSRNWQENWRDRNDYRRHTSHDSRVNLQNPWERSGMNDAREYSPLASSNDKDNTAGKQLTYREWKEAQKSKSKTPHDERPPVHKHSPKSYRDKTYPDKKPNFKNEQYSTFDSRSRPHYQRDKTPYEQKEYSEYHRSPTYFKSPSSSLSPSHYGDMWTRKRASSNNSDLVVSNKKIYREKDHSTNSNQS